MPASLQFGDLPVETFFAEYWRKRPIFLKGAATDILGFQLGAPEFRQICDRLERDAPHWLERTGDGTVFAQNMDTVSDRLHGLSQELAEMTSCRRVWFDGVLAVDGSGIGCHYDHSDNFVLQQSGRKIWRIHGPDIFSDAELRARMLDAPEAGMSYMPDDALEFVLDAGDVLYIPLFWAHWGVSVGPSLSVSIVYNADNALDLLLPELRAELSEDPKWWHPVPVRPTPEEQIDAYLEGLIDTLRSDATKQRLLERWKVAGYGPVSAEAEAPAAVGGGGAYGRRERGQKKEVLFDLDLIAEVTSAQIEHPTPQQVLALPGDETLGELQLAHRAQDSLRSLRMVACESSVLLERAGILGQVRFLLRRLGRLDAEGLAEVAARPEVASWFWRAEEAVESCYLPRIVAVSEHLAGVLLPTLAWGGVLEVGPTLRVPSSAAGVNLLAAGKRLVPCDRSSDRAPRGLVAGALPPFVDVTPLRDGLLFDLGDRQVEVARDHLDPEAREAVELEGATLVSLAVADCGALVVGHDAWCSSYYPIGGRFASAPLAGGGDEDQMLARVNQACTKLDARWPGVAAGVALVMPRAAGPGELHGTAEDFPGLIAIGPHADDATLLAEIGHDRFNGLLAADQLVKNLDYERASCPLFGQPRSFVEILRAVFGRTLTGSAEASSLAALDVVEAQADLTEAGSALVAQLRRMNRESVG